MHRCNIRSICHLRLGKESNFALMSFVFSFFSLKTPLFYSVFSCREHVAGKCKGKPRGYGRGLWGSVTGLWGYTWVQRWFRGLQTPPLLDTSTILLWPLPAGGHLISLNHISLEGVTFSEAAEVIQSSPEEVQLIVSQPKGALCVCVCVYCCVLWLWTLPSFVCV